MYFFEQKQRSTSFATFSVVFIKLCCKLDKDLNLEVKRYLSTELLGGRECVCVIVRPKCQF